jgi:ABC-type sugar transport system ATPase subunit
MNLVPEDGVSVGFRPEHFHPAGTHEPHSSDRVFPFVAHREEYLGSERLIYGAVGDNRVVARFPATFSHEISMGVPVDFEVSQRHLKYFDRATSLRIERPT